jgi:hypothetical protein
MHTLNTFCIELQTGHMLDNMSATTIAGCELEAMSTEMKSNLVANLDKSLNTSVNKFNYCLDMLHCSINLY